MAFTPEQKAKLRRRCQTDLYFLCKDIFKWDFTEYTHKAMCDFYPKLDPDVSFKEWATSYPGPHDYMMLVPRNTFKSYLKVAQNAQMIVTYPEVRIISLTSTKALAEAFVTQLNNLFVVKGNAVRDELGIIRGGIWTIFQELFPEHCITESESYVTKYINPCRNQLPIERQTFGKEPTIAALSIETSGSGWHCDIMDNDDPISDQNAETGNQLEALDNRISMAYELLMNYGFRFTVATRYHPMDPYGSLARDMGVNFLYGDYEGKDFKYMCRPCWWLKGTGPNGTKTYQQPDYRTWVPKEEELELFFPEFCPFKALVKKMRKPKTFFSQQLNSPVLAAEITFTEQKVRDCFRDHAQLPKRGRVFATCDIAYTANGQSDYSVIAIGLIDDDNRCWIVDIIRGRWVEGELPLKIVQAMRKHSPEQMAIEDCLGAKFIKSDLERYGKQLDVDVSGIYWVPAMSMNKDGAKMTRIGSLEPLMTTNRFFILNTALAPPNGTADDLILEFMNYPNKKARNDIVDAISQLTTLYLPYASAGANIRRDDEARDHHYKELAEKETFDMIFGQGRYEQMRKEEESYQPADDWKDSFDRKDPITGLPSF